MGNSDDAALEGDQQVFQPLNGVQVQVVGRFVQQQHIRLCHQGLCQRHALAGTAGQCADDGLGVQVQALQGFFYALFPIPGVIRFNDRLQCVEVQALSARQILVTDGDHGGQAFAGRFKHGGLGGKVGLLRHIGNAGAGLHLQAAIVWLLHTSQYLEQRGLACAVASDQANTLVGLQ